MSSTAISPEAGQPLSARNDGMNWNTRRNAFRREAQVYYFAFNIPRALVRKTGRSNAAKATCLSYSINSELLPVSDSWTTSLSLRGGKTTSETHSAEVLIECRQLAVRSRNAKERRNKIDGSRHCLRRDHRSLLLRAVGRSILR